MSENPLDTLSEDEQQALVDLARASESNKLSRRDAMKALGMLGLGGLVGAGGARVVEESVDPAAAQASGTVGTSGSPVDVFAESVDADQAVLTDAAADPSSNGQLQRNGTDVKVYSGGGVRNLTNIGTGSGDVSVSDDGTQVVAAASDLNFVGVSVTDDGDGTVTIGDTIDMGTL